jgi:hypothetical protein
MISRSVARARVFFQIYSLRRNFGLTIAGAKWKALSVWRLHESLRPG